MKTYYGVEAEPGIKDTRKVLAFIRRARTAFAEIERPPEHEGPGPFDWNESG